MEEGKSVLGDKEKGLFEQGENYILSNDKYNLLFSFFFFFAE